MKIFLSPRIWFNIVYDCTIMTIPSILLWSIIRNVEGFGNQIQNSVSLIINHSSVMLSCWILLLGIILLWKNQHKTFLNLTKEKTIIVATDFLYVVSFHIFTIIAAFLSSYYPISLHFLFIGFVSNIIQSFLMTIMMIKLVIGE